MARQIQIRRGTATENNAFTGAIGEVTMDTTNKTLRVHDGKTAGGTVLAKQSDIPVVPNIPTDIMNADYVVESQIPTAENNYTWYRKYKSGWVEQGGITNEMVIILPVIMSSAYYSISLTSMCAVENNNIYVLGYRNESPTGFIVQGNVLNNSSVSAGVNSAKKNWYVSGIRAE